MKNRAKSPNRVAFMLFLSMLLCLQYVSSPAQTFEKSYAPNHNFRPTKATLDSIKSRYKSSYERGEFKSKSVRQQVKESLEELSDNMVQLDSVSLLMHRDTLTSYLNSLISRIQAANPSIASKRYHVLLLRSSSANASNRGDGIIVVNLDLFRRLRSEAELVFILCHELSHDIEGHVMDGIIRRAELYGNTYKKEVKKAGSREFERNKATIDVYTSYRARFTDYRRRHEYEADSIGLMLYANLGYPFEDAVNVIELLDSVDMPYYDHKIDLKKYFDFSAAPFNPEWLDPGDHKDILGGNVEEVYKVPDSLKTHPECKHRSEALVRIILEQRPGAKVPDAKDLGNYQYYKTVAEFEMIESLMDNGDMGFALHNALQMLEIYPQNLYLHCAVANCLYEISMAQLHHKFSITVAFPDKTYSLGYNELLVFLHNLSRKDLIGLTSNYCSKNVAPSMVSSPFAAYVACLVRTLEKPQYEFSVLAGEYQKHHSDKYYSILLNKKINPNFKSK